MYSLNLLRLTASILLILTGYAKADEFTAGETLTAPCEEHQIFIEMAPGDCIGAVSYYREVGARLGLKLISGSQESTVTQIVDFLGFAGLTANDLEVLPPDRLMPANKTDFEALAKEAEFPDVFAAGRKLEDFQNDRVVAVRYFAPKVANYDKVPGIAPATPGWRKLVRLQALDGSPAQKRGIRAAWILFNIVTGPEEGEKFGIGDIFVTRHTQAEDANAQAIQIILEREAEEVKKDDGPSIYFLTYVGKYERNIKGLPPYGLSLYLEATFDVVNAYPDVQDGAYYVPGACAQCHGFAFKHSDPFTYLQALFGPQSKQLNLNYLATDQWQDARRGGDFASLDAHDIPLLIDADPDKNKSSHAAVFDRFRRLNSAVAEQNCSAQGADSLAVRSVKTWLGNHENSDDHIDRWDRILPPVDANSAVWSKENENDAKLLESLDRYCARCHVTMFFGIYDKQSLVSRVYGAIKRVGGNFPADKLYLRMPQGRDMTEAARNELVGYLETLQQETAPQTNGAGAGGFTCP